MPPKSKAQARFMRAAAAGKVRGKGAPSKSQAKEFLGHTPTKGLPERKGKTGSRSFSRPRVMGAILLAVLIGFQGCASMSSADSNIVASEKLYERAVGTFNIVFTIEDTTQGILEAKIPGTHALVEKMRHIAKQGLPALLNGVDTYHKNGDKTGLEQANALIGQALLDAERILNPPVSLRRQIGVGEILALLTAGQQLVAYVQNQVEISKRHGEWTSADREAVNASWSLTSTSHAWLTDAEGGQ